MGWPTDRAWRMLEAIEEDASDGTDHETLDLPADLVLAVCARIRDLYRKVVIDE